jgi:AraC family transcriptional regulator
MLSTLQDAGYFEKSLVFPKKPILLHSMISSCGYQKETKHSYSWHGIQRGSSEFALFQYTTAGKGWLRYNDKIFDVTPGQAMLLFFPHDNHYRLPEDSPAWEFVYVCLYGGEVMRFWREFEKQGGPLIRLGQESKAIAHAADICLRARHAEGLSPFEASSLAYALTMELSLFLSGTVAQGEVSPAIKKAADYCKKHFSRPVTVDELAEEAGYSRFHFTRLFTAMQGVSPAEYLQQLRIKSAIKLLQTTGMAIKEISDKCGFYDATHFCKQFRKSVGVSPRAFRESGMY